jgi:hypothetical protein
MRKVYLLALTVLFSVIARAQSAVNYNFTTTTTGSLTDMSSGTTQLLAANIDDTPSPLTNIGFDFFFQGVRYSQFSINENGVLRLGATAQTSTPYKPLGQAGIPIITAYGADQRTHAGDGKVHYKVTGSAPNRTLIVEWLNNQANFNSGGTADLTYHVLLSESTGAIQFVYGNMTMSVNGAASTDSRDPNIGFSSSNVANSVGSVTAPQSGTPAPTYDGATATPVANLYTAGAITTLTSAANGSRRTFSFTPTTSAAPSALNFTAVTPISMTLNWTDNSSDETGFAIYRSTDGVNYTFSNTVAANTVTSNQTGLAPSTNYFWQVYAVKEALSSPASGSQATNPAGSIVSAGSGLWSSTTPNAPWPGGIVPASSDNVTIADGTTVTIDIPTAVCYNLTVGQGASGVLDYLSTTASTLTAGGDVTVAAGGTFQSAATGTVTNHSLSLSGNIINNGTIDFSTNGNTAGAVISFTGNNNSTFTGTGGTTDLFSMTLAKASRSVEVELNLSNFSVRGLSTAATGGLLTSNTGTGTLKISGTNAFDGVVWSVAGYTIPATLGFWLNNPNFTVNGQNGSPTHSGLLRISQGTYNIGTATGNSMGFSAGSVITMEGGAVNATGRFGVAAAANAITYTQSGGTVTVCTVGNASTTLASFDLGTSLSSVINWTAGTVVCQLANTAASGPRDYRNQAGSGLTGVPGGTLQMGNAASGAAKSFTMRGVVPSLVINNTSAGHSAAWDVTLVNYNNLCGNITINTGCTLNCGNVIFLFNGTLFTNNGTFTHNGASSRFFWFNNSPSTYTGTGNVTAPMSSFEVQSTGGVTIDPASPNIVTNRVILFVGGLTNSNKLTLGNGGTTTGIVQIGNTTTPTDAGTFDVPFTFNLGTGGQTVSYLRTNTVSRTMGPEINPTRVLTTLSVDDNDPTHTLTLAGGNLTISSGTTPTFTFTNGKINLNSNTLTLGLNATTAALAGAMTTGAASYMYNGFFKRWISATTGNRDFPMGVAAFKRNAAINFTTAPTGGGSLTAQWVSSPGGANGLPLVEGAINVSKTANEGYWTVSAGDGLTGGNYTGTFTANGISGVTDVTQLVLVKRPDAVSPWVLDGTHVTGSGTPASLVISRTGMSGFSDFGIGSSDLNTLPVSLLSFGGQREGTSNRLRWTTTTEQNNRGFEVQRSADGVNYAALGFVDSRAAGGNSTTDLSYTFIDNNPAGAKYYYRLRQVDLDNHSKFSNVIVIKGEKPVTMTIEGLYPNPANTKVNVLIGTPVRDRVSLMIVDMSGKAVLQQVFNVEAGSNTIPVDISRLSNGNFLVKLICSNGCEFTVSKFVKQ